MCTWSWHYNHWGQEEMGYSIYQEFYYSPCRKRCRRGTKPVAASVLCWSDALWAVRCNPCELIWWQDSRINRGLSRACICQCWHWRNRDKSEGNKALAILQSQHWCSAKTEENSWEQLENFISLDYTWDCPSECLSVIWALSWSRVRAGEDGRDAEEWVVHCGKRSRVKKECGGRSRRMTNYLPWVSAILSPCDQKEGAKFRTKRVFFTPQRTTNKV